MSLAQMSDLWWKNAVIYCLDIETFYDSNGDGWGDLTGLIEQNRIPRRPRGHLSLVDALLPIAGPRRWIRHHRLLWGRHVVGNAGGLRRPHPRRQGQGLRVIIDLVVNHTSDRHPWFQASPRQPVFFATTTCGATSRRRGLLPASCSPMPRTASGAGMNGPGSGTHHHFYAHQPDLNYANPVVRGEIEKIAASGWSSVWTASASTPSPSCSRKVDRMWASTRTSSSGASVFHLAAQRRGRVARRGQPAAETVSQVFRGHPGDQLHMLSTSP